MHRMGCGSSASAAAGDLTARGRGPNDAQKSPVGSPVFQAAAQPIKLKSTSPAKRALPPLATLRPLPSIGSNDSPLPQLPQTKFGKSIQIRIHTYHTMHE